MAEPLHVVSEEELPVLRNWLEKFLPDTLKIYRTIIEQLRGRWHKRRYLTLGWPDILAVGEGDIDANTCKCSAYFNTTRCFNVFSPDLVHLETLLKRPDFLDWSKPIIFDAIPPSHTELAIKLNDATGTMFKERLITYVMEATADDLKVMPVPEGYELRPLDPDLDTDYVTSTWPHRRKYADQYVYDIIKHQPALGLFDRDGQCIAVELTTEYGFPALLHVREEARGRGLGQVVASHLAQKIIKENGKVYATILLDNKPSIELHRKIGYRIVGKLEWFMHSMEDLKCLQ